MRYFYDVETFCSRFCVDQLGKWKEVIVRVVELITSNIPVFGGTYFDAKKKKKKKKKERKKERKKTQGIS